MLVPIVRVLLRGGLAAADFATAARLAYARAAALESRSGSRRPNVSRIAATTGLTRREIGHLLRNSDTKAENTSPSSYAQPLMRVVQGWKQDKQFMSKKGPKPLRISGKRSSFQQLVKSYGGDVTVVAVLHELERLGCIRRIGKDHVRLIRSKVALSGYEPIALTRYGLNLADFARSLGSDQSSPENRSYFNTRESKNIPAELIPLFIKTFSERADILLDGFENWTKAAPVNSSSVAADRAGIGIYLILPNATE
jgi:Family of unknown function (DUF6502)